MAERFNPLARRAGRWIADKGPTLSALLGALVVWWAVSAFGYAGRSYLFPGPGRVLAAALENSALIAGAAWVTFSEAATGFAVSTVLGIAIAAIITQASLIRRGVYPLFVLFQTVPVITIAPIIVLWSGYGMRSVVLISTIMAIFPIMNNAIAGLESTSRNLIELFAMHRAGRWRTFWDLRLPAALPSIIAGLRTAGGLSVIGAIVGEFIIGSGGNQGGLGIQIIFAQGRLNTPLLFAEVGAASLLGFVFFQLVEYLGHLGLRRWHESARVDR